MAANNYFNHNHSMFYILLAFAALINYLISIITPRQAERFSKWLTPGLEYMENYADKAPGLLGWLLRGPFWASRKSLHKSKDLGKKTRDKLQKR